MSNTYNITKNTFLSRLKKFVFRNFVCQHKDKVHLLGDGEGSTFICKHKACSRTFYVTKEG